MTAAASRLAMRDGARHLYRTVGRAVTAAAAGRMRDDHKARRNALDREMDREKERHHAALADIAARQRADGIDADAEEKSLAADIAARLDGILLAARRDDSDPDDVLHRIAAEFGVEAAVVKQAVEHGAAAQPWMEQELSESGGAWAPWRAVEARQWPQ